MFEKMDKKISSKRSKNCIPSQEGSNRSSRYRGNRYEWSSEKSDRSFYRQKRERIRADTDRTLEL